MKFEDLRKANIARYETTFTNCSDWKMVDWTNAICGECGELANLAKKIKRGLPKDPKLEDSIVDIANEMADIITYIDILAMRLNIDLGEAVRNKFNEVSDRHKSNIKL